jgi:hypothetical protein
VQRFFHLKFWIPTEMPRRDLTLTDKIALLEQIKNKLPNTSSPAGGDNCTDFVVTANQFLHH